MRILFTICGRAGSKGIRNKNIRKFCGKYLPYFTVSVIDLYLKRHPEIEYDIVVNSDSTELISLVTDNTKRFVDPIMRDKRLAGDLIGKIDVINDSLIQMEQKYKTHYDMIVDLDITSPLRRVDDLERVINMHLEKKADVTTTVTTARRNPYFNQIKRTGHGIKRIIDSNFTTRQQAPEIFDMNASIYAYKPEYLNAGKGVLDGYCEAVEMYDTGILDLDHENDFELMEVIGTYLFKKDEYFREVYENIPEKICTAL